MSKEKRRVPKLRFPGFTEDWEQRKLGDIATFSKGNGYSKSDLSASGNPIILYGRLYTNYETTIRNVDTFVELKNKSVISQGGEVIVPASGETAEDISRASVVKNQGVIIGGDLNVIKVNSLLDPIFLALTISNGEQQKELSKRAQGKSVVHLHNSDLQEVNLIFPLLNEQKEISTIFEKMDNIITLHQRKLNNLKLKKKALLQKLFPKNGERYPELRFPGFTDAWEQCKLGEVVKSYSGGTPTASNKEYYGGDIPFIRSAEINSDTTELYITPKGLDNSSAKIVEKGTILYAMYGATSGEVGISKINGAINQAILAMIPLDYNGKIIAQYLRKNKESIIGKYLQGGQGNLSANIILELPIQLPGLEESNQIANFLESFDKIITLHQRKLDHLQLQKKALLQQMFV